MNEREIPGVDTTQLDEIVTLAKNTAEIIARCDDELAVNLVRQLNEVSLAAGVIGRKVLIISNRITHRIEHVDEKTGAINWVTMPAEYTDTEYDGRFAGFSLLEDEGKRVLAYLVQESEDNPQADASLAAEYRAPVIGSTLVLSGPRPVEGGEAENDSEEYRGYEQHLEILSRPDNSEYQSYLRELVLLFERIDEWDARSLVEYGHLCVNMLRALGEGHDPAIEEALIGIVKQTIEPGHYRAEGHVARMDGEKFQVYEAKGVFEIDDIDMLAYYETEGTAVNFFDVWQPAFVDKKGAQLPFIYLQHLERHRREPDAHIARAIARHCIYPWREDYLNEDPDQQTA